LTYSLHVKLIFKVCFKDDVWFDEMTKLFAILQNLRTGLLHYKIQMNDSIISTHALLLATIHDKVVLLSRFAYIGKEWMCG